MEEFMSNSQRRRVEEMDRRYREYEVECNDEWCYRDEYKTIVHGVQVG